MQRIVFLILMILTAAGLQAQDAVVKRVEGVPFEVIPAADRRTDLNGEYCALIHVEVLADDVTFEGNLIGPVKHAGGEYRVYLSPGTKFLRIKSNSFLPLMITFPDYGINGVQPNGVYAITLSLPAAPGQQPSASAAFNYLVLKVTPADAKVTVDGSPREVRDGIAKVLLRSGATYPYHVEAPGYLPADGQAAIGAEKVERAVTLRSVKGSLTVKATTPSTEIYVNGEKMGSSSWSGSLLPGAYTIEGRCDGYSSVSESIEIATGDNRTITLPALSSIKGSLAVSTTTPATEIFINDVSHGTGSWKGDLMPGTYLIQGRKTAHRTAEEVVNLATGDSKTISLPELQPIIGSLNVDYEPTGATISIDGTNRGTTPAVFSDLLIGHHTVTISANGYTPATLTANIAEGALAELTGTLSKVEIAQTSHSTGNFTPPTEEFSYKSFEQNGKWGFKDEKTGKVVIPAKYDGVDLYLTSAFGDGLAGVELNGKCGFIDKTGAVVIPLMYDFTHTFSEGLAAVELNGKLGFIDHNNKTVIPFEYSYGIYFYEGLAAVMLNGKFGFIDKNNKVHIDFQYDYADQFSEGLATVKKNGKWGYIDKKGNVVIPFRYDQTYRFTNGKASVELNGREFEIDRQGREVK